MSIFKILLNGDEVELEATRQGDELRVMQDGKALVLHVVHRDENSFVLEQEQADGSRRRIRVAGHQDGEKRQLWVNGRLLTYERVQERGSGAASGDASLAASIPAVVSQVLVNPGDSVGEGDKLILLESMKMVIPIQAPYDAQVTALHCAAGDSVQAGVQLIELEPLESER